MRSPRESLSWAKAAGVVVGVVGGLYAVISFVDQRIEKKLTEDETLKKVAELVRPSCIFDERGSILFDSGAMRTIEEIKIEVDPKREVSGRLPYKIRVRANRHLAYAPLLSAVDPYALTIQVERGEKHDWVYTVSYVAMGIDPEITKCRFRLEVL